MTYVDSNAKVTMKPKARSKMTNARLRGKVTSRSLFLDGDGRSPWSRRYRDLVALFADDAGGLSTLTELKLSLIRRCAALVVECERMENALADGEKIDIDLLARMSSHIRRISETIGLDRAKRDLAPSLADIVAQHATAPTGTPKPAAAPLIASDPVSLTQTPSALDGDGDEDGDELKAAE
jgi:hypothetical protein